MRLISVLLTVVMISAILSFSSCGTEGGLKITGSPASKDGVTVTLEKATAERRTHPDRYEYSFSGTIKNTSDEGVMKVIYTFELSDKNGEVFRSFGEVYDGVDKALAPNASVPFSIDGVKWGAQSIPASVEIGISSVSKESELHAVKAPQAGDHLYQVLGDEKLANIEAEPPVELSFHVDQGGYGRTATFGKGEQLDRAVALLCDIRIAGEVDEWVTDNYNWISLTWEDGSSTFISLNRNNLEYYIHSVPHIYKLENLSAFWNYAAEYLIEDK